jgi:flagellar biosynthesis/type III secretory pathway protein FliH
MNPNWKQIVREHLAILRLPPEREIEIVGELALRPRRCRPICF